MRRLFALVAAIVLVDTMFFTALTPLLPGYADELGLSKAEAGLLAAAYPLGVLVAGLPAGFAAARFGVKPTVLAGLAIMAATTLAFGFGESIWLLDAARFAQGLASSFAWAAGLAWLTDAAPAGRRGELIGSAMAAAIVGALLGPVLGAVASTVGTELAFGAVAALTVGLVAWALATPARRRASPSRPRPCCGRSPRAALLRGAWFVALPALLFGVLGVLAPLRLDELGVGAIAIGGAFLLAAALEATLAPSWAGSPTGAAGSRSCAGASPAAAVSRRDAAVARPRVGARRGRRRRRADVRELLGARARTARRRGGGGRAGARVRVRAREHRLGSGTGGGRGGRRRARAGDVGRRALPRALARLRADAGALRGERPTVPAPGAGDAQA